MRAAKEQVSHHSFPLFFITRGRGLEASLSSVRGRSQTMWTVRGGGGVCKMSTLCPQGGEGGGAPICPCGHVVIKKREKGKNGKDKLKKGRGHERTQKSPPGENSC